MQFTDDIQVPIGVNVELNRTGSGPESQASYRARAVTHLLQELWGDELPCSPDPVHTVLSDAVCIDDEQGRAAGLLVQGDAVSLDVLHQLLRSTGSVQERLLLLPPALSQRLVSQYIGNDVDRLSTSKQPASDTSSPEVP